VSIQTWLSGEGRAFETLWENVLGGHDSHKILLGYDRARVLHEGLRVEGFFQDFLRRV